MCEWVFSIEELRRQKEKLRSRLELVEVYKRTLAKRYDHLSVGVIHTFALWEHVNLH